MRWMERALMLAEQAASKGEVPVGAVLVKEGSILAEAHNNMRALGTPMAHAEMMVLFRARPHLKRLDGCDLYVTLEPCPMCAHAISLSRIRRLYFGAYDPKGGGVEHGARIFDQSTCHHKPEVFGGMNERACADLLQEFFMAKR